MVLSAVNGVGLSLVIPNAQSITADYYDELDRGKAFGALYMTSALGGAFGSLYATNQGQCLLLLARLCCRDACSYSHEHLLAMPFACSALFC